MNHLLAERDASVRDRLFAATLWPAAFRHLKEMNISRKERRVLGVLALGGRICLIRDDDGKTLDIECYTREGWIMTDCTLPMFKSMRAKKVISSLRGGPYRITRHGLELLRE